MLGVVNNSVKPVSVVVDLGSFVTYSASPVVADAVVVVAAEYSFDVEPSHPYYFVVEEYSFAVAKN